LLLKALYNISPLHPLAKYPGPLLWRASRIPASLHHARGDLYQRIAAAHRQYGKTVRIAPDELSFTSPEAWSQIYNSRPQLQKTQFHFAPNDAEKLPESMITASDTEHMRLRRLTGPAFLNAGINEVASVPEHFAELLCTQLAAASKDGTSQNLCEWFLWTLNDVIGQLALDQEFQCLEKRRMHPWPSFLLGALKQIAAVNQFRRFGVPVKLFQLFMTQDMKEAREGFLNTAQSAVNQRLALEKDEDGKAQLQSKRPDIVGLMLREMKGQERLTDAEITSNSILIVGGGAETTSTCLSATFYHLCKTPRVVQKLAKEIRSTFSRSEDITIRSVANLPYLKATIDESLRIFPVASYITPRVTPHGGHVIDGDVVPAGVSVRRTSLQAV
jgi:cytochrome P450